MATISSALIRCNDKARIGFLLATRAPSRVISGKSRPTSCRPRQHRAQAIRRKRRLGSSAILLAARCPDRCIFRSLAGMSKHREVHSRFISIRGGVCPTSGDIAGSVDIDASADEVPAFAARGIA
ncbi:MULTISPECIES: hypothetical protein [Burkholderia]|uniref:hypothetical protein n=1 Tax=Burkholderia TaxID=32008 RepID=UPI0012D2D986|nr:MULTISPECIES: hypothetical protein [Burkholderia]